MAKNGYATASRKKILEYLKENKHRTLTVLDIDAFLKASESEVNLTTIYRYLDKLEKEGTVMKYVAEKGSQATYQFVESGHHCEDHLHMQCVKCGRVYHLECHFMQEILEHVERDHGFVMQCKNSIIYGTCRDCIKAVGDVETGFFTI